MFLCFLIHHNPPTHLTILSLATTCDKEEGQIQNTSYLNSTDHQSESRGDEDTRDPPIGIAACHPSPLSVVLRNHGAAFGPAPTSPSFPISWSTTTTDPFPFLLVLSLHGRNFVSPFLLAVAGTFRIVVFPLCLSIPAARVSHLIYTYACL